ncbi:MAG: hypothetical protein JNL83_40000 [Myxococcales bacterium]|nr:hypothetical protein [Myxococcales bacterium]
MLRTSLAALACVVALPSPVAAGEPRSDLDAAIAAAKDGRCHEALELTRAIANSDRAFYAAHVPTEPRLAVCRAAVAKAAKQAASRPPEVATSDDEGAGKAEQITIATAAGALAWFGGAYLGANLWCAETIGCGADDEGPGDGLILGASIATLVSSTTVVYLAGRDGRHEDSILTTAFGAVGGGFLGTAVGVPMMAHGHWVLGTAVMVGSSAVGATVGFHLGRSAKKRGLEIVPTASSGFTGAVLGGTF